MLLNWSKCFMFTFFVKVSHSRRLRTRKNWSDNTVHFTSRWTPSRPTSYCILHTTYASVEVSNPPREVMASDTKNDTTQSQMSRQMVSESISPSQNDKKIKWTGFLSPPWFRLLWKPVPLHALLYAKGDSQLNTCRDHINCILSSSTSIMHKLRVQF